MDVNEEFKALGLSPEQIEQIAVASTDMAVAMKDWSVGFTESLEKLVIAFQVAFSLTPILTFDTPNYRIFKRLRTANRKTRNRLLSMGKRGQKRPGR